MLYQRGVIYCRPAHCSRFDCRTHCSCPQVRLPAIIPLLAHLTLNLSSPPSTVQVVLSTAHPAKFSDAVTRALHDAPNFNFESDVLPPEFKGLLERERRVIDVAGPDVELVKQVIERFVGGEEAGPGASV